MAVKGLDILVSVGATQIGGQRGASLSMSADDLDISDKTTGGWKASLAGAKEWSVSCDGLVVLDDEGYKAAVDAFMAGNTVTVKMENKDKSFGYTGEACISSFDFDAPLDDALTYSMELKGAGALAKIVKPGA